MSIDHCAQLVARADPDRFLSAMSAPPGARARLLPLYAALAEIARAPWVSQDPTIGLMRLQFWDDALAALCAGQPPPPHPVLRALAPVIAGAALPAADFAALIAARRRDRDPEPPADDAALDAYLHGTAVVPMRLAARALGAAADAAAEGLGHAMGAANLMRALPELARRGVLPLPGTAPADRAALAEGRTTP
ncbi:MAG: phytoene synthase, partial [Alphaproteobacteria bacterium]